MLLSAGHTSRRTAWMLASIVILGCAAIFRVWYVEPPAPPVNVKLYVPDVPVDPLTIPDFTGGPELKFDLKLESLTELLLRDVDVAWPQVQARRAEALKRFPSDDLSVPVREHTATKVHADEEYVEYRRLELEAYRQWSKDPVDAKDAGERFLKAYLEYQVQHPPALSAEQVSELGQAAIRVGSSDPLIRTYVADLLIKPKIDREETERVLTDALPLLSQLKYPKQVTAMARIRLAELNRETPDYQRAEKNRWPAAVVSIVRWLEEEADHPQRRRSVYRRFRDIWERISAHDRPALLVGCLQSKKIDPWLLHTILGDYRIEQGWNYRGDGFADTVEDWQWKRLHAELSQASRHLQYAWFLQPALPEPATAMITVAMADADREPNPHEWFARAVEAQIDYVPAYNSLQNSLRPRWGGSIAKMLEFGQQCVETNRFDTSVPLALFDILEVIRDEEVDSSEAFTRNAGVQALLRYFIARREAYRQSPEGKKLYLDSRQRRTRLALLMQECELLKEAGAELVELRDDVDLGQLKRDGRAGEFELAVVRAAQAHDPTKVVSLAETLRKTWNPDATPAVMAETEARLESMAPAQDDPSATDFYRHSREMWQQLRAYSRGEWVDLKFDSELSGWEIFADDWHVEETTGALRMSCRKAKTQRMYVRALAAFRPPFTLEFDVEMLEPAPYPFAAGVHYAQEILHSVEDLDRRQPFFGMTAGDYINRKTNTSGRLDYGFVRTGRLRKPTSQFLLSGTERHRVQLSLWNEAFELRIGEAAYGDVLEEGLHPQGGISLGEAYVEPSDEDRKQQAGELRLSNVRIRRLEMPAPPAETAAVEELKSYWQGRLAEDEEDPLANLRLAWVDWKQQRLDEATLHVRRALELCPKIDRAHGLLGRIEFAAGRISEAAAELKIAVTESQDPEELVLLAEILATSSDDSLRSGPAARALAERALQFSGEHHVAALAALAAACAELGEFDRAIETNTQAIELADPQARPRLQQRHENYKAGKPCRMEP